MKYYTLSNAILYEIVHFIKYDTSWNAIQHNYHTTQLLDIKLTIQQNCYTTKLLYNKITIQQHYYTITITRQQHY